MAGVKKYVPPVNPMTKEQAEKDARAKYIIEKLEEWANKLDKDSGVAFNKFLELLEETN